MSGNASVWEPSLQTDISGNTKSVEELIVAATGQEVFDLETFTYALGTGALEVHKNGLLLANGVEWAELTESTFRLLPPFANSLDKVVATGKVGIEGVVEVGQVVAVLPSDHIAVDNTDPQRPIVSTSAVVAVQAGADISVDSSDPQRPIVSADIGAKEVVALALNVSVTDIGGEAPGSDVVPYLLAESQPKTYAVPVDAVGKIISGLGVVGSTLNTTAGGPYVLIPTDIKTDIDIRLLGANGLTTQNTAALIAADAQATITGQRVLIPFGDWPIDAVTTAKGNSLVFESGARLLAVGAVTINSKVIATTYPVREFGGTVAINGFDIEIPADYTLIQDAINSIPNYQWQRFNVNPADGTYNEDVSLNNLWAASETVGSVTGERTGVYIVGATKAGVRVKSFMTTGCGGASFTPMIANLTVTGYNSKTNEKAAIEFYGCPSGAVLDVDFDDETGDADKAIMSYGSVISVETVDFGTDLYEDLLVVKHGGVIMSNSNTRQQPLGASPTGRAKRYACNTVGGTILLNDLSGLSGGASDKMRQQGNKAGWTFDNAGNAAYGIRHLVDTVSAYQTYFTNLANFTVDTVGVLSTVTIDPTKGLHLHSGTVNNDYAQAYIRRLHTIASQEMRQQQQLLAAVNFTSMADSFLQIGIGGGNSSVYIEVNATEVRGIAKDFAGVSTNVLIANTVDIVGDNSLFNILIERDNTSASSDKAKITLKVTTDTFESYKEILGVTGMGTNTFDWIAKLASTGGIENDAYIGELRLYRQ